MTQTTIDPVDRFNWTLTEALADVDRVNRVAAVMAGIDPPPACDWTARDHGSGYSADVTLYNLAGDRLDMWIGTTVGHYPGLGADGAPTLPLLVEYQWEGDEPSAFRGWRNIREMVIGTVFGRR